MERAEGSALNVPARRRELVAEDHEDDMYSYIPESEPEFD